MIRGVIFKSFIVIPPFCQSLVLLFITGLGRRFCRHTQPAAIADGVNRARPNAFAATDALGMVGCTDTSTSIWQTFEHVPHEMHLHASTPDSQQGHLVHEPIRMPPAGKSTCRKGGRTKRSTLPAMEQKSFQVKELSQRRSDARISD